MKVSRTLEDYLEAIYILEGRFGFARVRDIAGLLCVKPPSVTAAVRRLAQNGFVVHEHYGYVRLTKLGRRSAETIYRRHEVLLRFLTEVLGIPQDDALPQACGMEHSISCRTREALEKLTSFFGAHPDVFEMWVKEREAERT